MSKTLQTRIQCKHDTEANWNLATNFIPLAGEIIIYDDLNQIKIGNGSSYLSNLPFINNKIKTINGIAPDENGNVEIETNTDMIPVFSVSGTTLIIGNAIQMAEGETF